jgi:uncharacterized membrane protein
VKVPHSEGVANHADIARSGPIPRGGRFYPHGRLWRRSAERSRRWSAAQQIAVAQRRRRGLASRE